MEVLKINGLSKTKVKETWALPFDNALIFNASISL
jgi:hypothetical protein